MTKASNIYSLLSRLPLFQGMSGSEFDTVIARAKLGFSKAETGTTFIKEGERVEGLVFIISGEVDALTSADDKGYVIEERLKVPCVIQPERLFGLSQHYSSTFVAKTDCSLLTITKDDTMKLNATSEVFRLNMLNTLSTTAQKLQVLPWHCKQGSIRQKIFAFTKSHSLRPAGCKTLCIGMVRLGQEIGESRLNVSRELKRLNEEGLIIQYRNKIVFPAIENII